LGVKPLQSDGRAFYYSDYHVGAAKTYFPDAWPCRSGTLPQVAVDYRILIYFRDANGVFVNLYLPSQLRWTSTDGVQVRLSQSGDYPFDGSITMRLNVSRPTTFALRLRIPGWSANSILRVNGKPTPAHVQTGFAILDRKWSDGDRIQLDLALPTRLEAISPQHPNTVALVRGPLVLFAMGENPPIATRQQLLSSQRVLEQSAWTTQTASGKLELRPFIAINEERYNTYINI
jgi:DUF1680 family protein